MFYLIILFIIAYVLLSRMGSSNRSIIEEGENVIEGSLIGVLNIEKEVDMYTERVVNEITTKNILIREKIVGLEQESPDDMFFEELYDYTLEIDNLVKKFTQHVNNIKDSKKFIESKLLDYRRYSLFPNIIDEVIQAESSTHLEKDKAIITFEDALSLVVLSMDLLDEIAENDVQTGSSLGGPGGTT